MWFDQRRKEVEAALGYSRITFYTGKNVAKCYALVTTIQRSSMMVVVVSKIVPSLITERKGNITRNITLVLFIGVSRAGRFIDGHAWCELIFGFTLTQRGGNAIRYRGKR